MHLVDRRERRHKSPSSYYIPRARGRSRVHRHVRRNRIRRGRSRFAASKCRRRTVTTMPQYYIIDKNERRKLFYTGAVRRCCLPWRRGNLPTMLDVNYLSGGRPQGATSSRVDSPTTPNENAILATRKCILCAGKYLNFPPKHNENRQIAAAIQIYVIVLRYRGIYPHFFKFIKHERVI